MPTWDNILMEIENQNPLSTLQKYISHLNSLTNRTTICYMSAFSVIKPPVPSPFHSIIDQDIQGFMTCAKGTNKKELDLIIHTPGGDYEATKRIINYLHETYSHIRTIIPHLAMSGGTLIACASDEIYMGPYSSLGPTDPQTFLNNSYVPVYAILEEFKMAFDEVSKNPQKALLWNERLKQIPFGRLKAAQNMNENSKLYLTELLTKRNCKNKSKEEIERISDFLNSGKGHSSHGRGISLKDAIDHGLNVIDLRKKKDLEDAVLSIYHSAIILFEKTSVQKVIINNNDRKFINNFVEK